MEVFSLKRIFYILLLVISFSTTSFAQCASNYPCYPQPTDVAKIKAHNLTINSTCGLDAEEKFCISINNPEDCALVCDNSIPELSHPPELVVDEFKLITYWKSKNFDQPVFIQFDFGYKLLLHQVIITFQFDYPNGLYIQRSQNFGKTYSTLVYFAISCNNTFRLPDSTLLNGINVLCLRITTSNEKKQIAFVPRRDKDVMKEVETGGPARDYFLATNVKIILQEFFTPSDFDITKADPRRYFFAVRDVDVQAACYCNGMANECYENDYGTCKCQKNTEGTNCERCKPLYNNKEWRFGQACEKCECNEHADSCKYNTVAGYGICQNCKHNTMGQSCEQCKVGFYRNVSKFISDPNVCIPCGCHPFGVLHSNICNPVTGRCKCKSAVMGTLCDMCVDGFYGLSSIPTGCSLCGCSKYGTVNGTNICDKTTGVCPCKPGFTGRTCSQCKVGYYGYPTGFTTECRKCNCDPSGSKSMVCNSQGGTCSCRDQYYGKNCQDVVNGYCSASVNQLMVSSRFAKITAPMKELRSIGLNDSSNNSFNILAYSISVYSSNVGISSVLVFTVNTATIASYDLFLQYKTSYDYYQVKMKTQLETEFAAYSCPPDLTRVTLNQIETLTTNLFASETYKKFGRLCLTKGRYRVEVEFPSLKTDSSIFVISLLLLPYYESSPRYMNVEPEKQALIRQYYEHAPSIDSWVQLELRGAPMLSYIYGSFYENALVCGCNKIGTINPEVCNVYGCQCNCKKNVYGRTCSACLPAHYNFSSGLGCVPCACDPYGSLNSSCDPETGHCYCKPNVVGRTCNQCAGQYYNLQSGQGCKSCDCHTVYSRGSDCDEEGNCLCKKGVGSKKCDRCAPGFYDLSMFGCRECDCDQIGTQGNKCNSDTGSCDCKPLVIGGRCDRCKPNYYGFSADFPEVCIKCHCSGHSVECWASDDYYLTNVSSLFSVFDAKMEDWTSVDENLNLAGTIRMELVVIPTIRLFLSVEDKNGNKELFFKAPEKFLGNKKTSYMYHLMFEMTQKSTANQAETAITGDVIVKGKQKNFKIVFKLPTRPPQLQNFTEYKVQFYEKYWYKNTLDGEHPTSSEMLGTLMDLEYILIRAKWSTQNGQSVGLTNVIMEYSSYTLTDTTGLKKVRNVESCRCPMGYAGEFCEKCNKGFTRTVPNGGPYITCEPCKCNGHSENCDPQTGKCFNCQHNTEGDHCETCSKGYYGRATDGTPQDCKECKCPGGLRASNQFSQHCTLDSNNLSTCEPCETGYTGRNCEICSDGYYGNPMHPRGTCQKCICNNNIDLTQQNNCNTTTGECLRCMFKTTGFSCEYCMPGFFGDALTKSCQECGCNEKGSFGPNCQNITGQCSCRPNVDGAKCDSCARNTFNFDSGKGCELCNCHPIGSASQQCHVLTGKCTCKARVIGSKCDQCSPGFYNLEKGCLPCDCNEQYTLKNATCDPITGQCQCKNSTLGGPYSGRTCNECAINAIGSPPNCELCHSPCYDNWQNYIDTEKSDIERLQNNVTHLLSMFGGMSLDMIETNLEWLNGNLSYVMDVFSGAKYNTSAKESQFKQIETHIIEFETVINRTRMQLTSSKHHFETTVKHFNGSVLLSASIPQPMPIPVIKLRVKRHAHIVPKYVDAAMVTAMTQGFMKATRQNNITGQMIYSKIKEQSKEIIEANLSIADASERLANVMSQLGESARERAKVSNILNSQYDNTYSMNAFELKKIHDVVATLMILQNRTLSILNGADSTLKTAENIMNQAKSEAEGRKEEAEKASQTVSEMKVDIVTLAASVKTKRQEAADLKMKAETSLYDVRQETEKLADGVREIAKSKNKTEEALGYAYEIGNATMPVSMEHIKTLSQQIVNTMINEDVINETYTDAQAGLEKAQGVQRKSQQALAVSQSTLNNIKNLESTLTTSAGIRSQARQKQFETDAKISTIQNITNHIESNFNAISGRGAQTLKYLKDTLVETEANQMCFVDVRKMVDNATAVAKEAKGKADKALEFHQSNAHLLPTYSTQINALYSQTSNTHSQAREATKQADKLYNDVTEAERLLEELMNQKTELDALEAESDQLEVELNNLMSKIEEEQKKFDSCNRH